MQHTADADEHLIQLPRIAGLRPASMQRHGEVSTGTSGTWPDALMGHDYAAFAEDQLDVAQAEAEYVMQPDGMTDDLGRKSMPRLRSVLVCHAVGFAWPSLKRHQQGTCQCPPW